MPSAWSALGVEERALVALALGLAAALILGALTPVRRRGPSASPPPLVRLHQPDLPWRLDGRARLRASPSRR